MQHRQLKLVDLSYTIHPSHTFALSLLASQAGVFNPHITLKTAVLASTSTGLGGAESQPSVV